MVYVADKLAQGVKLETALEQSVDDLDGTFSFLVSTKDGIGFAKDRLAAADGHVRGRPRRHRLRKCR